MKELIINIKEEIIDFKENLKDFIEPKEVYFLCLDKFIKKK